MPVLGPPPYGFLTSRIQVMSSAASAGAGTAAAAAVAAAAAKPLNALRRFTVVSFRASATCGLPSPGFCSDIACSTLVAYARADSHHCRIDARICLAAARLAATAMVVSKLQRPICPVIVAHDRSTVADMSVIPARSVAGRRQACNAGATRRQAAIMTRLEDIIQTHRDRLPRVLALRSGHSSPAATSMLGWARGVICTCAGRDAFTTRGSQ